MSVRCAPERRLTPSTSTSSCTAAATTSSGVRWSPVYTTSMPASRRERATTLAPRSCPSRPTLAIMTRMGSAAGAGDACEEPLGGINRLIQDSRPRIKDAPARPWVGLPGGSLDHAAGVRATRRGWAPSGRAASAINAAGTGLADPPGNLTYRRGLRERCRIGAAGGAPPREAPHPPPPAARGAGGPPHTPPPPPRAAPPPRQPDLPPGVTRAVPDRCGGRRAAA